MDILTENFWKSFVDPYTQKFNGEKFENLIYKLLDRGFEGKWMRTKQSWDNAHDFFEVRLCDNKRWAECKMYKSSLKTHVFAKTLILAVNEDIDIILIFSYSPLVKNAITHLGDFAKKVGKKIQVFDDKKLEQLIFKYFSHQELKCLFPDLTDFELQRVKPIDIYSSFYKDITTSLSQFTEIENFTNDNIVTNRKSLNVYELILVSNHVDNDTDIQIDFSAFFDENNQIIPDFGVINLVDLLINDDNNHLQDNEIDTSYHFCLSPGEIHNIKLYVIPQDAGNRFMPPIKVICPDYSVEFKEIKFKVEEIDTPPYIGSSLLETIDRTVCDADLTTRVKMTVISGVSGVGKSRFSEEITQNLLKRNFDVYIIEGRYFVNKTFSEFIIEVLTQLYKIPNPYRLFSKDSDYSNDNSVDYPNETTLIEAFVNNKSLKYEMYKDHILKEVKSIFLKRKSTLIIDDVQFLDNDSMSFLIDLGKLNNQTGRNLIIYIFNTELLNVYSKHFSYYTNIVNMRICKHIEINEFSEDVAKLFLDSTLRLKDQKYFSDTYPHVYTLIIKNIPLRPFYLLQFLELAKERKCISLINGEFFVKNIVLLNELLDCPSDRQINILKERIINLTEEERTVLYIIGIFGNIDFPILESQKIINKGIILDLIDRKLLRNDNGILEFYHSLIDKFVIEYEPLLSNKCKKEVEELLLSKKNLQQIYPLALFSISHQNELFDSALNQIDSISQISLRNQKYANSILVYIYQNQGISPSRFIKTIIKIALFASQNNQVNYLNILNCLWKHLAFYFPKNDSEAEAFIEIIREIGSYYSVFNNFEESIKQISNGIKRLNQLEISTSLKSKLQSRLINRMGVSYKQERRLDEALKYTIEGYKLALDSASKVMECLSLIDLGYIYMGIADKNNLVLEYWDKVSELSLKYYDSLHLEDSDTAKASKHISALTLGIRGLYNKAISIASELIDIAQKECSAYYELQAKRAKIFFEYLSETPISYSFEEQINDLISLSAKYKIFKFHIFAYHMLAIYYEDISKFEMAKEQYLHILKNIFDIRSGYNIKAFDIYLLYKDSQRFFIENNYMSEYPLSIAQIRLLDERYSDIQIYPLIENCLFSRNGKYLSIP